MKSLDKTYDPKSFEDRLYDFWMKGGYFTPEIDKNKKPFTIMMPPPNVTGNLHMGHALNNTLQDILIRTKRMQGYSALWVPGTDHASISTEAKVVEKMKKEGKTKEMIGREGFLEEAWDWTHKYGGNIKNQLKKLGVSCDWTRDSFTLDEHLSKAVEEVFIRLYEKGLIYRGDRIINWCPSCKTAISDTEVEHEDIEGSIWYFKYPFVDGDGFVEIATTRPETIPGDLAVAVNPKDERYFGLVGKKVRVPILDGVEIPIIEDDYVELDFGSGAVKITPSHDVNDFEVGERHNLGQKKIFTDDGHLNELAGKYCGLTIKEARKKIIEDFKELGYFSKEEKHDHAVGVCERCKTTIEPLISKQWFVKMEPLAKPALEAYKRGEVNFIPERFAKVYVNWLENIRDWCISRQLWWGHRLPVYYVEETGETIVSRTDPSLDEKYKGLTIKHDEDTLDTWFSSALWPFSTLGWPDKTADLDYFFPTDVLITGYDIIFFWVSRMIFSSLEQMGEVPFKDVLFTGLVNDAQGRKMSKSLGNGIDPLEVIDKYGADALRFTLVTGNSPGNDMRFYYERVEANRNFANKLWNASRFVLMNLEDSDQEKVLVVNAFTQEDKWILTKLQETIDEVTTHLDKYEIGLAANEIYDFIWNEYCDWYIEMVKPRLYGEDSPSKTAAKEVLLKVLKDILKLLHPFMPFITEEIYSHLPGVEKAIIVEDFPVVDKKLIFKEDFDRVEYLKDVIRKIRNARSELDVPNSKKSELFVKTEDAEIKKTFELGRETLLTLGFGTELIFTEEKIEDSVSIVLDRAELMLPMSELINYREELERLEKESEKLTSEITRATKKLANEGFVKKAPESVVQEEKDKLVKYEEMKVQVENRIEEIRKKL